MRFERRSVVVLAVLAAGLWGCEEPPPVVGTLSVSPSRIELGFPDFTPLEIAFEPTAELGDGAEPLVMVHLLDDAGTVVRTFDHPLPGGWRVGEPIRYSIDLYQSALAPPLEPGDYRLSLGLYDAQRGRWALGADGEEVDDQEYAVASLAIADRDASAPKIFFSPSWQATEAGTDVQILGRRWLRGEGQIRVADVTTPGVLRLRLRIPPADAKTEDLVLSEGYQEVTLDVSGSCSDERWTFDGLGTHQIDLTIASPTESCEVDFTPHYQIVRRVNLEGRALAVDLIAWQPTGLSGAGGDG